MKLCLIAALIIALSETAAAQLGYTYLGCYKDLSPRDLGGLAGKSSIEGHMVDPDGALQTTLNSHPYCCRICSLFNFTYFGVEYGSQCFCGNAYGHNGSALDSCCSMPCSANSSQICGGTACNSVFMINYPISAPLSTPQTTAAVTPTPEPPQRSFSMLQAKSGFINASAQPAVQHNVPARSLLECAVKCSATGTCQAVLFARQRQLCRLYNSTAQIQSSLVGSDDEVFARGA